MGHEQLRPSLRTDMMLVYDLVLFLQHLNLKGDGLSYLYPAMNRAEIQEVYSDQRASRNFLNILNSFMVNNNPRYHDRFLIRDKMLKHLLFWIPSSLLDSSATSPSLRVQR